MTEQLFQIGIKAAIRNDKGEILLLRHAGAKDYQTFWDFPGGRMNPDETFAQTLDRELHEEIGVGYVGQPKLLTAVLSNHTIAVGDGRVALTLLVYEVMMPERYAIQLGDGEEEHGLFMPDRAAKLLGDKYPLEFCELIGSL